MSSIVPKRRSGAVSFLGFKCGCKDSKSVSVSPSGSSATKSPVTTTGRNKVGESSSADTATLNSAASTSSWEEDEEAGALDGRVLDSSASTPSFSSLLRQLSELEKTVMSWGACVPNEEEEEEEKKQKKVIMRRHGTSNGEVGGGRAVEECVPVVKESEDPLGDFRRSMLQMIIEKEIVDGDEFRELLRRFLALNSPRHHDLILRAFAEIWEEVFSGYEDTPDFLRRRRSYAAKIASPPF